MALSDEEIDKIARRMKQLDKEKPEEEEEPRKPKKEGSKKPLPGSEKAALTALAKKAVEKNERLRSN